MKLRGVRERHAWRAMAILVISLLMLGCTTLPALAPAPAPTSKVEALVTERATEYFQVYAERKDFNRLMSFYADEASLQDLIFGYIADDKKAIEAFFNWNDGFFELPVGQPALVLNALTVQGQRAVAQGHFTPFTYKGRDLGPWWFVTILDFNPDGLIVRHSDWINYTPRELFLEGDNLNRLLNGE